MAHRQLGDKGLSIFAFAAYHQLTSGEKVAEVVIKDGAGHRADPEGVREVEELGLANVDGDRAVFTDKGQEFFGQFLEQVRGAAKHSATESAVV